MTIDNVYSNWRLIIIVSSQYCGLLLDIEDIHVNSYSRVVKQFWPRPHLPAQMHSTTKSTSISPTQYIIPSVEGVIMRKCLNTIAINLGKFERSFSPGEDTHYIRSFTHFYLFVFTIHE